MSLRFRSLIVASLVALSAPAFSADRSANITVNPIGLLFGTANATAEFAVGSSVSVGPSFGFSRYTSGTSSATGWSLGLASTFFLSNGVFSDSWVAMVSADYASASANNSSTNGFSIAAQAGYGWFWDSGFNILLGGGVQYISFDLRDVGLTTVSGILPSLKFSLGFAF